ncbi:hypothetical protein OUZ56_015761 [Daphnia magna]|uniref:Uncharacterized protein n=1 Tax=Daphnia magna TaxID=35525 RepID=A0ABR0ANQ3_9CRUS|nr:hypothetical protein OUZ56_015761 [Daphnia magna]
MSSFSSCSSPLLLFKSKSFRRPRNTSGSPTRALGSADGASGGAGPSSSSSECDPPHRLRRVFTTHACRRCPAEVKSLGPVAGHASPIQFRRMTSLMKKPLGIAHSVPLGVPLNFNRQIPRCRSCVISAISHIEGELFKKKKRREDGSMR